MINIKFVYFDVGNVLSEYEGSFDETIKKFNINPQKFMELWVENEDDMTRGKMTPENLWNKAITKFNLRNGKSHDFMDSWANGYRPQKKVHEIIKKIKNKQKIGLLTNHYVGMVEKSIEKGVIPDLNYHAIVSSCRTGYRKPEKAIYDIATDKAGVKSQEILFIDDVLDFIEGAKKNGWNTVWFDMENKEKSIKKIEKILGL